VHSDGKDQGSEFVVRLPRVHADHAAAAVAKTPGTAADPMYANGAVILVVDDNEDAVEMLAAALTMHGCEVHTAHDGNEALRLGAAHSFDAAILDIGLPEMDGYELARRLRLLPNQTNTRLFALTGYGLRSDRERALAAGFEDHLIKPVSMPQLNALVIGLRRNPASSSLA